jgi:predicted adenylyl cyclase CyaB
MKEVEILVEVLEDFDTSITALSKFNKIGLKETLDIYFYDPQRPNLKLNAENKLMECCRLRLKDNIAYVAYKVDIYDGKVWQYSDEYETVVDSFDDMKSILLKLGLKELVTIDNKKHTYETYLYEIVLEEVKDLGLFLEVEFKGNAVENDIPEIKRDIFKFIKDLGLNIGHELNSGKPELLLTRKAANNVYTK